MDNDPTPPAPLVRGVTTTPSTAKAVTATRSPAKAVSTTPSPDKGRDGEGFAFLPYDKHLTALARQNRRNPTPAENLLWQKVLRGKQLQRHKFLRQKPIGPYIVDFYCAELRLVIEIDGDSHAGQIEYDAQRSRFLGDLGLHTLRHANRGVLGSPPGVYDDLLTHPSSQNHA